MGWFHGTGTSLLWFIIVFSWIQFSLYVLPLILDFSNQEKVLTQDQLAEMLSCNLAESVHNKWLQASGNKDGDLYVATVDDYIRVFLQVVVDYKSLELNKQIEDTEDWRAMPRGRTLGGENGTPVEEDVRPQS
jgi:hypothetical protein